MTCTKSYQLLLAGSFVLLAAQAATGTPTVLYTFTGGADGGNPQGPLVADPSGNLYGSAQTIVSGRGTCFGREREPLWRHQWRPECCLPALSSNGAGFGLDILGAV